MPSMTQRSVWNGLTSAQALELSDAIDLPGRSRDPRIAYEQVHVEYATRAVAQLVGNDLRGALWSAEIAAVCVQLAAGHALSHPSDSGAEGRERSRSRVPAGDRVAARSALDGRERTVIVAARMDGGGEVPDRLSHILGAPRR